MYEILGVDLGNDSTKTSSGVKFETKVAQGWKAVNADDIKIEYQGKKYTVGSGTSILGENRYGSQIYDLSLLTAIAKSYDKVNCEVKVMVSMPPGHFNSPLKETLKTHLKSLPPVTLTVKTDSKEEKRFITILDAAVFCESAIVYSNPAKYREQRTIVVDIGGGTADISEFNGMKLVDHTTTGFGTINLFEKMRKALLHKFGGKFSLEDARFMLGRSRYEIKQVYQDVSFLNDIVKEHIIEIANVINNNFNISSCKLEVIGGGALDLAEYFKEFYPGLYIPDNPQFINAITNQKVGVSHWNGAKA